MVSFHPIFGEGFWLPLSRLSTSSIPRLAFQRGCLIGQEPPTIFNLPFAYSRLQEGSTCLAAATTELTTTAEPLPPSASDSLNWYAQWWPICFTPVTDKFKPRAALYTYCNLVRPPGRELERCGGYMPSSLGATERRPHRPSNRCLECPYHGWTFEGKKGACTRIPQLEDGVPAPESRAAARIAAYPTTVAQGIIWVWAQSIQSLDGYMPDTSLVPLCPPLTEDPDSVCLDVSRHVPYSYEHVKENLLDPSHVPFTHHATIGRRSYAGPMPLKLTSEVSMQGIKGAWEHNIPASPMTKKHLGRVRRETVFNAPSYMHHLISTPELSTWTVTYATPSRPGKSRILARFPFKIPEGSNSTDSAPPTKKSSLMSRLRGALFLRIPHWLQHLQQNRVLDDDNIFLAVQERRLVTRQGDSTASWAKRYYRPTKADLFVAQFRKWIQTFGGGGPFGPLTKEDLEGLDWKTLSDVLLNRYEQHTRHCSSCSRALATAALEATRLWGRAIYWHRGQGLARSRYGPNQIVGACDFVSHALDFDLEADVWLGRGLAARALSCSTQCRIEKGLKVMYILKAHT